MLTILKQKIKTILPLQLQKKLRRLRNTITRKHRINKMAWGEFRTTKPISQSFGESGLPIDRYYMANFLESNMDKISGHVLEIGDNLYTKEYGKGKVTKSDILHVTNDNPKATIIADLTHAPQIRSNQFDCIILTQTLQFIYDKKSCNSNAV